MRVPAGTMVYDTEAAPGEPPLVDLANAGDRFVAAQGGIGGKGNIHFATSTNQAPKKRRAGHAGRGADLAPRAQAARRRRPARLPQRRPSRPSSRRFPARGRRSPTIRSRRWCPTWAWWRSRAGAASCWPTSPASSRAPAKATASATAFCATLNERASSCTSWKCRPSRGAIHCTTTDVINRELRSYSPEIADRPQIVALSKCDITETREAYDHWRRSSPGAASSCTRSRRPPVPASKSCSRRSTTSFVPRSRIARPTADLLKNDRDRAVRGDCVGPSLRPKGEGPPWGSVGFANAV